MKTTPRKGKARKPRDLELCGHHVACCYPGDSRESARRWVTLHEMDVHAPRATKRLIAWLTKALAWQREQGK